MLELPLIGGYSRIVIFEIIIMLSSMQIVTISYNSSKLKCTRCLFLQLSPASPAVVNNNYNTFISSINNK